MTPLIIALHWIYIAGLTINHNFDRVSGLQTGASDHEQLGTNKTYFDFNFSTASTCLRTAFYLSSIITISHMCAHTFLKYTFSEQSLILLAFHTFDQSDDET